MDFRQIIKQKLRTCPVVWNVAKFIQYQYLRAVKLLFKNCKISFALALGKEIN